MANHGLCCEGGYVVREALSEVHDVMVNDERRTILDQVQVMEE